LSVAALQCEEGAPGWQAPEVMRPAQKQAHGTVKLALNEIGSGPHRQQYSATE